MREIRRTAEHWDRQAMLGRNFARLFPGISIGQLQKAGVELQPFDVESCSRLNPLGNAHRSISAKWIDICFRKCGQLRHHSPRFVGLRPTNGYCSKSTTLPLIGRLSSDNQYTAAAAISSGAIMRPVGAYCDGI